MGLIEPVMLRRPATAPNFNEEFEKEGLNLREEEGLLFPFSGKLMDLQGNLH